MENEKQWCKVMLTSYEKKDDEWFSQRDTNIKTAKNEGGKKTENNATVMVRLAKRMNITGHSIVDNYYNSSSGVNVNNQLNQLKELRKAVMRVHYANCNKDMIVLAGMIAEHLSTMTATTKPAETDDEFSFNTAQDGVLSGLTDDAPKATATETDGYLLDEFDINFINENVDSAMIQETIGKLFSTNANGKFYQYGSKSIKTTDRPEWIEKGVKAGNGNVIFNGLFRQPMADLLQVRAKAQSTLAKTEQNPKAQFKHWFTELVANKTAEVKATIMKVVSYVMHHSGRNFWAKRIAWAVSPAFVESFKEYIGFNQEVADSPVMGGTAKDWNWPYEANDWEASAAESVDLSAMGLDLNDLKKL